MVKRKQGAYQEPMDPPAFTALSMEHLEWLDANFDVFQETYHRKWGELAKQMRKVFEIPERVDGITVRNKLLSYWVCSLLRCFLLQDLQNRAVQHNIRVIWC